MSVQFGRWNLDGKPLDPDYLENVKSVIAQYGPDGGASYTKADIGILEISGKRRLSGVGSFGPVSSLSRSTICRKPPLSVP